MPTAADPLENFPCASVALATTRVLWEGALCEKLSRATQLSLHVDADFCDGATIVGLGFL